MATPGFTPAAASFGHPQTVSPLAGILSAFSQVPQDLQQYQAGQQQLETGQLQNQAMKQQMGLAPPAPKYVGNMTPAEQQYYYSLPAETRIQAAKGAGYVDIPPDFGAVPMQPRSYQEVDQFDKEWNTAAQRAASGQGTVDQYISFINSNRQRFAWINVNPDQALNDAGVFGQMSDQSKMQLQKLANENLMGQARLTQARSSLENVHSLTELRDWQIKHIGAEIQALPQELTIKAQMAAAAMMNSETRRSQLEQVAIPNVQSLIDYRTNMTTQKQMQALQKNDKAQLDTLSGIYRSMIAAGKNPQNAQITLTDPATGQTQQITMGEALDKAKAQLQKDTDSINAIPTGAPAGGGAPAPPAGGNTYHGRPATATMHGKPIFLNDAGDGYVYADGSVAK